MSFNFGAWAAQSLHKLEGTLDDAFGFDENKNNSTATQPSSESSLAQPTQNQEQIEAQPAADHTSAGIVASFGAHDQRILQDAAELHQHSNTSLTSVLRRSDEANIDSPPTVDPVADAIDELDVPTTCPVSPSQPILLNADTIKSPAAGPVLENREQEFVPNSPESTKSEGPQLLSSKISSLPQIVELSEPPAQEPSIEKPRPISTGTELPLDRPATTSNVSSIAHVPEHELARASLVARRSSQEGIELQQTASSDSSHSPPLSNSASETVANAAQNRDASQLYKEVALKLRRREAQLRKQAKVLSSLQEEHVEAQAHLAKLRTNLQQTSQQMQTLLEEREQFRRLRDNHSAAEELLKAKDDQISAILGEGEKLSIKQAKMETTVRSARAEIKQKNAEIERLESLLLQEKSRAAEAEQQLKKSESDDRLRVERLAALSGKNESLEKELSRVRAELNQCRVEIDGSAAVSQRLETKMKANEVEAEHWKQAAETLRLEQSKAKFESQTAENASRDSEERENALRRSVGRLREEMRALEDAKVQSERSLAQQLDRVRDQLHEAEARNEDLASAVPQATRPLLRQITSLQQTLQSRSDAWQELELSLVERYNASEQQQDRLRESLSTLRQQNQELSSQRSGLDASLAEVSAERSSLSSQIAELEQERSSYLDFQKKNELLGDQLQVLKQSNASLEANLGTLQRRYDQDTRRFQNDIHTQKEARVELEQRLDKVLRTQKSTQELEKPYQQPQQQETPLQHVVSGCRAPEKSLLARRTSTSSIASQDEVWNATAMARSVGRSSASEVFGGHVHLQASLRRKQGEITELKRRLHEVENERDALSDELVALKSEQAKWSLSSRRIPQLQQELQELKRRHDTAIDMIGSLREENEELNADLVDVKTMFRSQVTELMEQMEVLRSRDPLE